MRTSIVCTSVQLVQRSLTSALSMTTSLRIESYVVVVASDSYVIEHVLLFPTQLGSNFYFLVISQLQNA